MKKFNLFLIEFAIGLVIICIFHKISNSFEAGVMATALYWSILQYINEKTKED